LERNEEYSEGAPEPRVLTRGEHNLSRRGIDSNALKVLYRLHNSGYLAYLVGGGVRDLLLGKKPKDFDISTDARPSQVKKLFGNSRIIGRRFRLAHVFFHGGQIIEVSTFRTKAAFKEKSEDSPVVRSENTFGTPSEDALRRDLTINGLFYNIADYSIIDYVGGLDDLRNGRIRVIGEPTERLREDPVRMIRVIRHAARTGFEIDPAVLEVIRSEAALLHQCPASRVREEFMRELRGGWSTKSFRLMLQTGLLSTLFPEYGEVLDHGNGVVAKEILECVLAGIDKVVTGGTLVPDEVLFGAFLSPLYDAYDPARSAPSPRAEVSYVSQEIRRIFKPIVQRIGASKGNAERICQMLFARYMIKRSLIKGALPKSLVRKVYFEYGLRLFQLESAGLGKEVPQMLVDAARDRGIEMTHSQAKKKNRRRRRRPRNKPTSPAK
jgi:poly(A) polymerase